VKWFGAVGDGVTDDASAIQLAVNASVDKTLFFPAGIYIVGTTINLPSNIRLAGDQGHSIIKLKTQAWVAANGLMFSLSVDTDVQFDSLVFDGNKGNVGATRSPIIVVFNSQRITFEDCTFQNCEGICLNVSTNADDIRLENCRFLSCGGSPDNSDGYRLQALAFSGGSGGERSSNIFVSGCYFYRQGLDCISLNDCDNVVIANNTAVDGYTLFYNNPLPRFSTNVTINGNVVRNCSDFGGVAANPPNAIDAPSVIGLVITGNALYSIDACGIGIFEDSKNVVVSGNTIIDPMRSSPNFLSGIFVSSLASNVSIEGNLIVDTAVTPLMSYGIVICSGTTKALIRDNVISNPIISRYGYTVGPSAGTTFTLNSTTQVSSSARIVDLDVANNLEVVRGRLQVQTSSSTDAPLRVTQSSTGNALEVGGVAVVGNASTSVTDSFGVRRLVQSISDTGNAGFTAGRYSTDGNPSAMSFVKSRNSTAGGHAILSSGDFLGRVAFAGSDGAALIEAARVEAVVDGTPALNSMPGRLDFFTTPSGSTVSVKRLSLKQGGALRVIPQATPATAESGDVYYDSTTNKLRCYNGTIWNDLF
jgi:parallel beta-helix repeat protein